MLVGDSLSSAHRIPVESGWVSLLQRRLQSATRTPPAIVNASREGKSMDDALVELPSLLARHHPQAVIVELGGNHAFLGADEARLRRDLSQLIDMARALGANVALLGFRDPPRLERDCGDRLRGVYRQVALDRHALLLPALMASISRQAGAAARRASIRTPPPRRRYGRTHGAG